jgi:hypothetical protein
MAAVGFLLSECGMPFVSALFLLLHASQNKLVTDTWLTADTCWRGHVAQARSHREYRDADRVRLHIAVNSCERAIDRHTHWA